MPQAHSIEVLEFDLGYHSEAEARSRSQRMGDFAAGRAVRVIGEVFDAFLGDERLLRLDRLEVDLGPGPMDEAEFEARLRERLRNALERLAPQASTAQAARAGVATLSRSQVELEALWLWLRHGRLPWTLAMADQKATDELVARVLASEGATLSAALRSAPDRPRLLARIARQWTDDHRLLLLDLLSPAHAQSVAVMTGDAPAWERALNEAANGAGVDAAAPAAEGARAGQLGPPWRRLLALDPARARTELRRQGRDLGERRRLLANLDGAVWSDFLSLWGAHPADVQLVLALAGQSDQDMPEAARSTQEIRSALAEVLLDHLFAPGQERLDVDVVGPSLVARAASLGGVDPAEAARRLVRDWPRASVARLGRVLADLLDDDEFGSNRSEFIKRDRSQKLARDAGGKPLRTSPHPALGEPGDHAPPDLPVDRQRDPAPFQLRPDRSGGGDDGLDREVGAWPDRQASHALASARDLRSWRSQMDLRLGEAAWDDETWPLLLARDPAWLARRLRRFGVTAAWRRNFAVHLNGERLAELISLWLPASEVGLLAAVVEATPAWMLGADRAPEETAALLRYWLLGALLLSDAERIDLVAVLDALVQARGRYDDLDFAQVALAALEALPADGPAAALRGQMAGLASRHALGGEVGAPDNRSDAAVVAGPVPPGGPAGHAEVGEDPALEIPPGAFTAVWIARLPRRLSPSLSRAIAQALSSGLGGHERFPSLSEPRRRHAPGGPVGLREDRSDRPGVAGSAPSAAHAGIAVGQVFEVPEGAFTAAWLARLPRPLPLSLARAIAQALSSGPAGHERMLGLSEPFRRQLLVLLAPEHGPHALDRIDRLRRAWTRAGLPLLVEPSPAFTWRFLVKELIVAPQAFDLEVFAARWLKALLAVETIPSARATDAIRRSPDKPADRRPRAMATVKRADRAGRLAAANDLLQRLSRAWASSGSPPPPAGWSAFNEQVLADGFGRGQRHLELVELAKVWLGALTAVIRAAAAGQEPGGQEPGGQEPGGQEPGVPAIGGTDEGRPSLDRAAGPAAGAGGRIAGAPDPVGLASLRPNAVTATGLARPPPDLARPWGEGAALSPALQGLARIQALSDAEKRDLFMRVEPRDGRAALVTVDRLIAAWSAAGLPSPAEGLSTWSWSLLLEWFFEQERVFDAAGFAARWFALLTAGAPPDAAGRARAALMAVLERFGDGVASEDLQIARGLRLAADRGAENAAPTSAPESLSTPPSAMGEGDAWTADAEPEPGETIYLANAGLVLAGAYVPMLFDRLGLTQGRAFTSPEAAERGAQLLQVLVDGGEPAPDHQLTLNKILCGLDLAAPLARDFEATQAERETIESLLQAMIERWSIIGRTSVAGLRETFLQRQGALMFEPGAWRLQVEPRAFDMLLDQIPWGYQTLKLPWMSQVLHVDWR